MKNNEIIKSKLIFSDAFSDSSLDYASAKLKKDSHLIERLDRAFVGIEGQDYACQAVKEYLFGINNRENEKGVGGLLVFAGSPAVGKTELAERIAKALHRPFLRVDMSAFNDRESSPLDFAGINESYKSAVPGIVTDFVYDHPVSVVLLDEVEKAHPNVLQLLLQMVERGALLDRFYKQNVGFKDVILIITTNAGSEIYNKSYKQYTFSQVPKSTIIKAIKNEKNAVTGNACFSEAIVSRFATGKLIMFNRLRPDVVHKIVKNEITSQMDYYSNLYKIRFNIDKDMLANIIIYNQGESADIRTLREVTKDYFKEHIERTVKSIADSGDRTFFNTVNYNIVFDNSSPEALRILRSEETVRVLVNSKEEDVRIFDSQKPQNVEFIYWNDNSDPRFLKNMDFCAAVIDIDKNDSRRGKELFRKLLALDNIPIYVYTKREAGHSEFFHYTDCGSTAYYSPKVCDLSLSQWIKSILGGIEMSHITQGLFRSNKVICFDTEYSRESLSHSINITLCNFRSEIAVSGDESENFVNERSIPNVRFEDIIGAENAKSELRNALKYITNSKKYARMGMRIPRGALLTGPAGTGKTMLAKAMAREAGLPFIQKNASEFLNGLVGEGAKKIRETFAVAKKYAPSIIFIDEIDAIAQSRMGDQASVSHTTDLVNAFLSMMDGFDTSNDDPVYVIAATNFSAKKEDTKLDPALLRRFDNKIEVGLPNFEERKLLLERSLQKIEGVAVTSELVKNIAQRSIGWNMADLSLVVENAARTFENEEGHFGLTDSYLQESFENFNDGEKIRYSDSDMLHCAYHEAGHALVSHYLGIPIVYTTIIARGNYGGYVYFGEENKPFYSKDNLLNKICSTLGGKAAEMIKYAEDGITSGASADLRSAYNIARAIICDYAMDGFNYLNTNSATGEIPKETADKIHSIIKDQFDRATDLLQNHWQELETVAKALFDKNSLTEDELKALLGDN